MRPLAACAFSGTGAHLGTVSWGGVLKLWDVPSGRLVSTIKGTAELVGGGGEGRGGEQDTAARPAAHVTVPLI